MKKIILISLLLAGCGAKLADRDAQQACYGFPQGTVEYANCYADAYQTSRMNRMAAASAAGASMMNTGAILLTQPSYRAPSTTTCSWFGRQLICSKF